MTRMLFIAALGVIAVCLTLAVPSASHAQYYPFEPDGYTGYGYYNYGPLGYSGHGGFGGYPDYGYGRHGWYGFPYQRRAIVHPHYLHWTPFRGLHSHGHVHVPHRGHYHTYPY